MPTPVVRHDPSDPVRWSPSKPPGTEETEHGAGHDADWERNLYGCVEEPARSPRGTGPAQPNRPEM
jgi:hypothetical protein